ncbi:adenylyl-sulfate kinase [Amylibacter sp.]|nr:adenylyl-sulfate kinase [Amylibacter sp.]
MLRISACTYNKTSHIILHIGLRMMDKKIEQSGVIWISGFSASGKTTVGRHVEHLLHAAGHQTLFLDGDQLRSIFANKWDYTPEGRTELALIYFRLCSHLSKQGVIVIISAVAMLDGARKWFKKNVENGMEVYLKVPEEERIRRDSVTKNIYNNVSFRNDIYTESEDPDLIINNYAGMGYEEASSIVVNKFLGNIARNTADYGRTEYWAEYYNKKVTVNNPSPFAEYCLSKFTFGNKLLEIGCGNGRDAKYFSENGINVVALDKSEGAIEICKQDDHADTLKYVCCETSDVQKYYSGKYNYIYSRFSLHAMTESEELNALKSAYELLESKGNLFIECRSINDSYALKGEVLSPTERIDGHYRRFIDLMSLEEKLKSVGFIIVESVESSGLAVFKDEDPIVIRIIAKK